MFHYKWLFRGNLNSWILNLRRKTGLIFVNSWAFDFVVMPNHEIHEIKCPTKINETTVHTTLHNTNVIVWTWRGHSCVFMYVYLLVQLLTCSLQRICKMYTARLSHISLKMGHCSTYVNMNDKSKNISADPKLTFIWKIQTLQ